MDDAKKDAIEQRSPIINGVHEALEDFGHRFSRLKALCAEVRDIAWDISLGDAEPRHDKERAGRAALLLGLADESFADTLRTFDAVHLAILQLVPETSA